MTPRRWLLVVLSFLAAVAVAMYVIASHWPDEGAPLGIPWWAHLVAVGAVAVELALRCAKIAWSARACGIPLTLGTAARATLCGDFLDAITPARLGAEPARFLVLREAGMSGGNALVVLFLELLLELLSLIVIASVVVMVLPWSGAVAATVLTVGGYGAFVLGVGAIGLFISRRDGTATLPRWARLLGVRPGLWERLLRTVHHFRIGVSAFRRAHPGVMAVALGFSVLHVLARLAALPIIVFSYGASVPWAPLVVWPLALLYAGAITPAPSGGGVMELGFSAALDDAIPPGLLAASLIWWRFYSFYSYVLLGAFAAGRTAMRALGTRKPAAEVIAGATNTEP
jgi:uncharacterized protein (TIRG00374 family)